MKNITSIIIKSLFAILIGGLLAAIAEAQVAPSATATIPFAFSANSQHVAAGTYKVKLLSDRFLSIRNVSTGREQLLMVRPEAEQAAESQGSLVFQRREGRNFLSEVRISGTNVHSELITEHGSRITSANAGSSGSAIAVALQ